MAQKIYSTPNSDDFYVIPEFLEHQQCWMVWPERTDNWRLGAKPAQEKISKLANIISEHEHVNMIVWMGYTLLDTNYVDKWTN